MPLTCGTLEAFIYILKSVNYINDPEAFSQIYHTIWLPGYLCGYISQSIMVKESLNQKPLRERDELTDLF